MERLRSIIWILTGACNLDCKHCYAKRFLKWQPEVSKDEVIRVLREAIDLGLEWVNFSGGELLLFKKWIIEVLSWLRSENVEPSLVTNAMFITDSIAERFKKAHVHVYVSLDGNRESHESMRGKGTWDATIAGIRKLVSKDVKVTTVMAVSKLNYKNVADFVNISNNLGVKSVAIIPVMPFGNALKYGIWIGKEEYLEALKTFEEAVERAELSGSVWCTPWMYTVIKSKRLHAGNCRKQRSLDIAPDGSVLLCDVLDIRLGSVVGKPLREVWMEYLSHPLVKEVRNPSGGLCSSCPFYSKCLGGCYARALQSFGKLEGDPLCPFLQDTTFVQRKSS